MYYPKPLIHYASLCMPVHGAGSQGRGDSMERYCKEGRGRESLGGDMKEKGERLGGG